MGGRTPGIKETKPRNTAARKEAARLADEGITPLDVLLTAMREDWMAAQTMLREQKPEGPEEAEVWTRRVFSLRASAIATADKAAPYVHSRLATATIKDERPKFVLDVDGMDDQEIEAALKLLRRIVRPADDLSVVASLATE